MAEPQPEFDAQPAFDPQRCPLCGEPNGCAMAAGAAEGSCWCASVTIPRAALECIPVAARGVACVCRRCAERD